MPQPNDPKPPVDDASSEGADGKDESKEQPILTDLEAVHERAVHEFEEEDNKPSDDEEGEGDGEGEADTASKKGEGEDAGDDAGDEEGDQPSKGKGEGDQEGEEDSPPTNGEESKDQVADHQANDGQSVGTQTGKYEITPVKVKDSDGVEHEFTTADDIPDDFEPETYKGFAVAVQSLAENSRKIEFNKNQDAYAEYEEKRKARLKEINEAWDKEISSLQEAKRLPDDETKRKKVVDDVFALMREEMEAERPVNSFTHALEIYEGRELKKREEARRQAIIQGKKNAGSKVLPSGTPQAARPAPNQGRVIEAPPSGVSLDQVHEKVLGSL